MEKMLRFAAAQINHFSKTRIWKEVEKLAAGRRRTGGKANSEIYLQCQIMSGVGTQCLGQEGQKKAAWMLGVCPTISGSMGMATDQTSNPRLLFYKGSVQTQQSLSTF